MFLFAAAVVFISINCWALPSASSATDVSNSDTLKKLSAASIVVFAVIFFVCASPRAAGMRFSFIRIICGASVIETGAEIINALRCQRSNFTVKSKRLSSSFMETLSLKFVMSTG